MKQRIPYFLLIIFLLIADQVTKALIARNILLNSSKQVIPGFFQLTSVTEGLFSDFFPNRETGMCFCF